MPRETTLAALCAFFTSAGVFTGVADHARAAETPPLSDVIERLNPEEYLVKVKLHVEAYRDQIEPHNQFKMNLENTPLVFPIVPDGGFHEVDLDRLSPELHLDDRRAPDDFKLLDVGSLDAKLARFVIKEFKGKQVDIRMEEYITAYDAKVDEKRAMRIKWPDGWESEIASALQPQAYIESSNETFARAVKKMVGDDPKRVPPYLLAKVIARATVEHFQVSGDSISRDRHANIDGFNVKGAEHALTTARGTWFDAVCLYVGLCRAAGLPARPVIGLDNEKRGEVTAWGEFFLPTAGWVSVDLRELFASPGMMRQFDRHWKGFGTNDELNELVPIAHHFHPPVSVFGGGIQSRPMLWGWLPRPEHTPNNQRLRLILSDAPQRGGRDPKARDRSRSKDR